MISSFGRGFDSLQLHSVIHKGQPQAVLCFISSSILRKLSILFNSLRSARPSINRGTVQSPRFTYYSADLPTSPQTVPLFIEGQFKVLDLHVVVKSLYIIQDYSCYSHFTQKNCHSLKMGLQSTSEG